MRTDLKQGIVRLRAAGIAALCAGAAGVVITQAPAGAQPLVPFPLVPSPDCDWDTWNTASDIDQHNGSVVHISWGTGMRGAAAVNEWRGQIEGPVVVKGTNEIDFTIPFSSAGAGFGEDAAPNGRELTSYGGSINPDGSASGTWSNQNNGASGTWDMGKTFRCTPNKPAADPAPADKPVRGVGKPRDPNAQTPAATDQTATITDDVQLFDDPGGVGVYLGDVKGGRKVKVLTRKDDNWVEISGSGVPGFDTGWVWGDYVGP